MRNRLGNFPAALCMAFSLVVLAACALAAVPPALQEKKVSYTCPMDPEVRAREAGKCPRCGMDLRATDEAEVRTDRLANSPATRTRPDGSIEGLKIPDVYVVDQDGRRLRFFTDLVKGRTVAINFMFTTCTTICPPLAVTFARLQTELASRGGNEVLLISVSVDPVTDVPARMKAYLSKYGGGPGWVFVGGAKPDIDELLRALGAYVSDKTDHAPMILVGNEKAGYWTRAFGLAPAGKLASIIAEATRQGG
jgi:cytochrome oxidase Cu insertion factor (SCO1/SenC/PrrC family)